MIFCILPISPSTIASYVQVGVGSILVFSYCHDISFKLVILLRNTENRIIKISNGINTIVIRVLECSRVMPEKLLSESGTKAKYGTISVYKRVQMKNHLTSGVLFVELAMHM